MSYLLDTHTFIWSLLSINKLPKKVIGVLEDTSVPVRVSVITFWEISLKYSIGKLELHGVEPDHFPSLAEKTGYSILPLAAMEVAASYRLAWMTTHKDSFDRMLIWQALKNDLTLISGDESFNQYLPLGLKSFWK